MESVHNFSLFSNDLENYAMDGLDLGLFPELSPLTADISDEEHFIDTPKVGMADESFMCNPDLMLSAIDNNSNVQAQQKANGEQRIVKILIAKDVKPDIISNISMKLPIAQKNHILAPSSDDGKNFLSKNAIAARENRVKKKKYIEEMENSVSSMSTQLRELNKQAEQHVEIIKTLKAENRYLRNVLANDKEISALLKTVKKTPGLKFIGSSITKRQLRSSAGDDSSNESTIPRKKRRLNNSLSSVTSSEDDGFTSDEPVGVCLHVANGSLSIEFCPTCSSRASLENLEP